MRLFIGNERSFGRWFPTTGQMTTTKRAYEHEEFAQHVQGKVGLGIVPILDDGTVRFAAIDVDAHADDATPIDVAKVAAMVEEKKLPLIVCHSKRKGCHLYAFFSEPVPAQIARSALQRWAIELGFPGVEIFPKQSALPADRASGERPFGQWINLPYFGGDQRVCIHKGEMLSFDEFVALSLKTASTEKEFNAYAISEHGEAPPCIQRMYVEGVKRGGGVANNALYSTVVYLKRAFPNDWRDRARSFNRAAFSSPLDKSEEDKTIASASKRDYQYKCKEEPLKSMCNRQVCLQRAFGITQQGGGGEEGEDAPLVEAEFSDVMKYETIPVRWQLSVDGKPMILPTKDLHSFGSVRARAFELLHVWVKPMSQTEWEKKLNILCAPDKLIIVETPDDVSQHGDVQMRLMQYLGRAVDDGKDHRTQMITAKPQPTYITYEGTKLPHGRYIAFSFSDFKDFLRRTKGDEFRSGIDLHTILAQHCGVKTARIRCGSVLLMMRLMPAALLRKADYDADIPESEL